MTQVVELRSRLATFLVDLKRAQSANLLSSRLQLLLPALKPLLPIAPKPKVDRHLDHRRLTPIFEGLSNAVRDARATGFDLNPWEISGLKRQEVRNASVLAALWSPIKCGTLAVAFLQAFLHRLDRGDQSLPDATELAGGYAVRTEWSPGMDGRDRVDLLIESTQHMIGVEIKIDAPEGPSQLARYVEAVRHQARIINKTPVIIMLAPFAPSHAEVLTASWHDVRAAGTAILPRKRQEYSNGHRVIADFVSHTKSF